MTASNRPTILLISATAISIIMLIALSKPFIFFGEKLTMCLAYSCIMGYLIFRKNASKLMFRYKRVGYIWVLISSILLLGYSSVANLFQPVYDREIIGGKIYYIVGNPGFNNDWYTDLIEYDFWNEKRVSSYVVHGPYEPNLSIKKRGSELYIQETQKY